MKFSIEWWNYLLDLFEYVPRKVPGHCILCVEVDMSGVSCGCNGRGGGQEID